MKRKFKTLSLGALIALLAYSMVACMRLGGGGKLTGSNDNGAPYGIKLNSPDVSAEGALYGVFPSTPK